MQIIINLNDKAGGIIKRMAEKKRMSAENFIEDVLNRITAIDNERFEQEPNPCIGMFKDQADLLDEIVKEAYEFRRTAPLRAPIKND